MGSEAISEHDEEAEAAALSARAKANLIGIACAMGAASIFSVNDVLIKLLSGGYPLHEITFIRGVIATTVILAVFVPIDGGYANLRTPRWRLHLLRSFTVVAANMTYYAGLASLALSEATAIYFMAPLFITLLSALVLGERVGPRRIIAVVAGLAGVLIIIRPGFAAFQLAAILPLIAAFLYASVQIMARKLGMGEKASTMSFYINFTFILFSGSIGLVFGDGHFSGSGNPSLEFLMRAWVWPPVSDWPVLIGIGVLISIGAYLTSHAYRSVEAALLAPFEYIAMPLAIVFSVVIWGDWPDAIAWLGIVMIAFAGLFVIFRETRLGSLAPWNKPLPRNR